MTALLIIGSLLLIEIVGIVVTYLVCYLYYKGPPVEKSGVTGGWHGGDAFIMIFFWPITLAFFVGRTMINRLNKGLANKLEHDNLEKPVNENKTFPRSGQETGIYNSDFTSDENAAGTGSSGRGMVRRRRI